MCGFVGIYNYKSNKPVAVEPLVRMRDSMIKRGPDGEGLWISKSKNIGLGHRRLAIVDLSDDALQPMTSECGQIKIVYNGEIYNYKELREELEREKVTFRSESDTEVILKLYARIGLDFANRLRGMYAISIWDNREQRLLMVRDPFGIKPLYYSDNGKSIQFGSQVKAILAGDMVDTEQDPAGLVGFFLWGHIPEPFTLFRNIRALPPGSVMEVNKNKSPIIKYFKNPFVDMREFCVQKNEPRKLDELLLDSIKLHLQADVPVGVFLSAGIDSATVCALASEIKRSEKIETITLGFEDYINTANDEVPLAEKIAHNIGTNHRTRWLTRKECAGLFDTFIEDMDQPSIDGLNTWIVSKVAAESGLKVAISGIGGDELFGGYSSFRQIPIAAHALKWVPSCVGKLIRQLLSGIIKAPISPKYAGIFEYGGTFGGGFLLSRGLYMPWELKYIIDEDIVNIGLKELDTYKNLEATISDLSNDHCRIMALEINWYLKNQLLKDTDWAGMGHSLEIRTPLVDTTLFNNMLHRFKKNKNSIWDKNDLAKTAKNQLPQKIINRAKSGFNVPVRDWIIDELGLKKRQHGLRDWAMLVANKFNLTGLKN